MTNLQPAIDYFGSQALMAKAIGVNPMAITQWKRRGIPARRAKQISDATNGKVKASDLLPDLFL
jgi:DNA-binding transcriptional regulator YdaS (Cro superfamily)